MKREKTVTISWVHSNVTHIPPRCRPDTELECVVAEKQNWPLRSREQTKNCLEDYLNLVASVRWNTSAFITWNVPESSVLQCLRDNCAVVSASDSHMVTGRCSPTFSSRETKVLFSWNSARVKQMTTTVFFSLESMQTCTAFNSGRAKHATTANLHETVRSNNEPPPQWRNTSSTSDYRKYSRFNTQIPH